MKQSLSERVVALSLMEEKLKASAVAAVAPVEAKQVGPEPVGAAAEAKSEAARAELAVEAAGGKELVAAPKGGVRKYRKLEELPEEGKHLLLLGAPTMTLIQMVELLASQGVKTSTSAVSRFLRKWEAEAALSAGDDLKEAAEKFAARGEGSATRAGALAAARERVFERVVSCKDPEESMRVYQALVAEEERLKKLALEERKARAQERSLELQGERLRLEAAQRGAKLLVETMRGILCDERLGADAKVNLARARLERWRGEVIDVEDERAGAAAEVEAGGERKRIGRREEEGLMNDD